MGVDPADLVTLPAQRSPAPAFAAYIPVPTEAVPAGTRRAYSSYWKRSVAGLGVLRWLGRVRVGCHPSTLATSSPSTAVSAPSWTSGGSAWAIAGDLVIAWTLLPHTARTTFRTALQVPGQEAEAGR